MFEISFMIFTKTNGICVAFFTNCSLINDICIVSNSIVWLLHYYIIIVSLIARSKSLLREIISLILTNESGSSLCRRYICKERTGLWSVSINLSFLPTWSVKNIKMYSLWNWQNKMTNARMIGKSNRIIISYRKHSVCRT